MKLPTADIYELGHVYFAAGLKNAKLSNRKIDNYFAGSYFLGIINFLLKFLHSLMFRNKRFPVPGDSYEGIVVYGPSRNNRLSLEPVVNAIGKEKMGLMIDGRTFPSWKLYWYALPHLSELIKEIRKAEGEKKEIIKFFFPKFLRMYGCPKVANQLVDFYKPKLIILANDHLEFNHCLMLTANSRGVKTMYVQHAAVGTTFPSLQFTYSLLDGKDAYNKYKYIGNLKGNIYLLGGVRFDLIDHKVNNNSNVCRIGLAINLVDEEEIVKRTCLKLKQLVYKGSKVEVVLRPHPQMSEKVWRNWCEKNSVSFSSSQNERSFDYIQNLSCLVANQCSIHLDAAMCKVPSVVFDMSNNGPKDVYGFLSKGLVKKAENMLEISRFVNSIENYEINVEAVKFYDCSFGTSYEGNVAMMISKMVESILSCDNTFNKRYGFKTIEECDEYTVWGV